MKKRRKCKWFAVMCISGPGHQSRRRFYACGHTTNEAGATALDMATERGATQHINVTLYRLKRKPKNIHGCPRKRGR